MERENYFDNVNDYINDHKTIILIIVMAKIYTYFSGFYCDFVIVFMTRWSENKGLINIPGVPEVLSITFSSINQNVYIAGRKTKY